MLERKQDTKTDSHADVSWKTKILFGAAKAAAVIPTQPLHVIQKMQQAKFMTAPQAFAEIRKSNNFSAFFKGTTAGAGKEFIKCVGYKAWLLNGAPGYAKMMLPASLSPQEHPLLHASVAGTFAGVSDLLLGGPLDNVSTFQSTSQGAHAKAKFFEKAAAPESFLKQGSGIVKRLYRGALPAGLKSSVAFTTSFYTKKPIKNWVKDMYHIPGNTEMPWYATFTSAVMSGGAVAVTCSALDIAKTQAQMPNPNHLPFMMALKNNFKQHGVRAVTAGIPIKFLMVAMGWGINYVMIPADPEEKSAKHKP